MQLWSFISGLAMTRYEAIVFENLCNQLSDIDLWTSANQTN